MQIKFWSIASTDSWQALKLASQLRVNLVSILQEMKEKKLALVPLWQRQNSGDVSTVTPSGPPEELLRAPVPMTPLMRLSLVGSTLKIRLNGKRPPPEEPEYHGEAVFNKQIRRGRLQAFAVIS